MSTPDAASSPRRFSASTLSVAAKLQMVALLVLLVPLTLQAAEPERLAPPVFADGSGLPAGSGSSEAGKAIYAERCAACHGPNGEGGSALELQGDASLLATAYPDRGIGVYWPNAPALFDYVRRSMPPADPWSMSVDETYAVVAFLLDINGLMGNARSADAALLADLQMPNANGFVDRFPSDGH